MPRSNKEKAEQMRASRAMKAAGRTGESLRGAIESGTVPDIKDPMTKIVLLENQLSEMSEDLGAAYEIMNQGHRAMGQGLQEFAAAILRDEDWKAQHIPLLTPEKVVRIMEIGVKIEREALGNMMSAERARKAKQGAMDGGNIVDLPEDLTKKILADPNSIDFIHQFSDILEFVEE